MCSDGIEGADRLPRDGIDRHAGERAEGLEPGRHVGERVRVQRSRAAVVTGVQRAEQLAQLGAAALPDDEAVGPHPKRLPHQPVQPDASRPVEIRLPGLEGDDVRVRDAQLGDILDDHDALVARRRRRAAPPAGWSCRCRPRR